MIELEAVSVQSDRGVVLDRVTFSVGSEVVALIGPSGAGKTTLLRAILGLEALSAGQVRVAGRVLSHGSRVEVRPEERNVAMVFQDLALWPHFSVHENLAFGLKAHGISRVERERSVAQALDSVGLSQVARLSPNQLSGGERQRVAIARALVGDPIAVLLDEPLGSLDVALKEELLLLFARLFRERGLCVLYVTHDPREVVQLAARVVVIEGGRRVQEGALAELAAAPASPFVASFVRAAARHQ